MRRGSKRIGLARALVGLALAVACAGGSPGAAAQEAPPALKVAIPEDIITLDPSRYSWHRWTRIVHELLFQPLVSVDGEAGAAAVTYEPVDSTTWAVVLPKELVAATGEAISTEAAARYYARLLPSVGIGGYPAPARERLPYLVDVRAEGDRLLFVLSQPDPMLPARLAQEPFAALGADGRVLGTGSYRVERWDHGNRVVLRRVAGEGPETVTFEVIPSAQERLQRLISGDVDIAFELPPGALWQLRASRSARAVRVLQRRVHFIEFDTTRPPFNDRRVRLAMNLAVDTGGLIDRLMQDEAAAVPTLLVPATLGFDPEVPEIGYDPVRALELLAAAGYPRGFSFELDVTAGKERIARGYASMLAGVGIDVTVRVWPDWASLKEEILLGRRQAWMAEWGNTLLDPAGILIPKLHTRGEANYGGYSNETLDALLDQAEAVSDPGQRLAEYQAIQRFLWHEAPVLFGYAVYDVFGVKSGLMWSPGRASANLAGVRRAE